MPHRQLENWNAGSAFSDRHRQDYPSDRALAHVAGVFCYATQGNNTHVSLASQRTITDSEYSRQAIEALARRMNVRHQVFNDIKRPGLIDTRHTLYVIAQGRHVAVMRIDENHSDLTLPHDNAIPQDIWEELVKIFKQRGIPYRVIPVYRDG